MADAPAGGRHWSLPSPAGLTGQAWVSEYLRVTRANQMAVKQELWSLPGMTEEIERAWRQVYAAAPSREARRALAGLLRSEGQRGTESPSHWVALGEIGPLAYAAGLTLTEARACATARPVDVERLRVLASLRGWALPRVTSGS